MKKKLPYLNKDFKNSTKSVEQVKWYSVMVETANTKRYHAGLSIVAKIGTLPRLLIDFLCEKMSPENIVENTHQFKKEFNAVLLTVKKKTTPTTALIGLLES